MISYTLNNKQVLVTYNVTNGFIARVVQCTSVNGVIQKDLIKMKTNFINSERATAWGRKLILTNKG